MASDCTSCRPKLASVAFSDVDTSSDTATLTSTCICIITTCAQPDATAACLRFQLIAFKAYMLSDLLSSSRQDFCPAFAGVGCIDFKQILRGCARARGIRSRQHQRMLQ